MEIFIIPKVKDTRDPVSVQLASDAKACRLFAITDLEISGERGYVAVPD
jgi:hypothetical protein